MARWQFAITTVCHFLFVPITISLSFLIAGLQTAWVRTGKDKYFKALVLLYQGWTYWVFRKRIGVEHIPA